MSIGFFNFQGLGREASQELKELKWIHGGVAQLGEHLLCTQGVKSSNLLISTIAYESKYEAVKSIKFKILGFVA